MGMARLQTHSAGSAAYFSPSIVVIAMAVSPPRIVFDERHTYWVLAGEIRAIPCIEEKKSCSLEILG